MILLFSGTGNSLHVANMLAKQLGETIIKLPVNGNTLPSYDFERIIWVFPVYSWGIPPVVARWIASITIPGADKVAHHAVMTCGDDVGLADKMWIKAIERRGWTTAGTYSVQMPNTYVLMKGFNVDPENVALGKIDAARSRVIDIAERIRQSPKLKYTDVVRGAVPWIKTKLIYPWFVKFEMSPKPFHHTPQCTGCATCARYCPMKNISMVDGHPCWGQDCALCLGCYHVCPHHAVAYGKVTASKGQKEILRD